MSNRYRLEPTAGQAAVMARHCSDARFVWNLALEQANGYRPHRESTPNNAQRMRQLAEARQGSWLGEGSSVVQQSGGTVEEPGQNVAQKRGLNRSISEQCWGIFAMRLRHKIGDRMVLVNPAYTSQTCSACGHRCKEPRESQARFVCRSCGVVERADVNAALNIVALGQRVPGRGGMAQLRPPDETSTACYETGLACVS